MVQYQPEGVCASKISFEIKDGVVKNVRFTDGCPGNAEAVGRLVEGLPAEKVIEKLRGIQCQNGTSCADQLAKALERSLKTRSEEKCEK